MPKDVSVCTIVGRFFTVDLDECDHHIRPPLGWDLGAGAVALNRSGLVVVNLIESRLIGARTAQLGFAGCNPITSGIYRDRARDRWFVEVTRTRYLGEKPQYAELSRDEATAWLRANRYETPADPPEPPTPASSDDAPAKRTASPEARPVPIPPKAPANPLNAGSKALAAA